MIVDAGCGLGGQVRRGNGFGRESIVISIIMQVLELDITRELISIGISKQNLMNKLILIIFYLMFDERRTKRYVMSERAKERALYSTKKR